MDDIQRLVVVATGHIGEMDLIMNILAAHNINSYLKDEIIGTVAPHIASPGGAGAVKICVVEPDVNKAKVIIEDIRSSASEAQDSISENELWSCLKCGEKVEVQFNQCWNCQSIRPEDNELI